MTEGRSMLRGKTNVYELFVQIFKDFMKTHVKPSMISSLNFKINQGRCVAVLIQKFYSQDWNVKQK